MVRAIYLLTMMVFIIWQDVVFGLDLSWAYDALAIVVAGYLLAILVHELGHVVVGSREGLPLRWIAVGPLMMDVTKGRRLRRSPFGGAVGGCAVFDLGDLTDEEVGSALCRMSAGGPVASLILAVVCLGLPVGLAGLPSTVAIVLQGIGGLSLFMGLANAIPFRVGTLRSDGLTYLTLVRGGEAAASLVRDARLTEPAQGPGRPAGWPAVTVARMRETLLRLEVPVPARLDEWLRSAYLLYWYLLDRGQVDDAQEVLRRVARAPRDAKSVKTRRYDALDLLTALHLALWEGDGETAARIVARFPRRSFVRRSTLWTGTEAAILLARGDFAGALKKAKRTRRRLAPFVDLMGILALEQRCWASVIARAEAALARQHLAVTPRPEPAPVAPVPAVAAVAPAPPVGVMGPAPVVRTAVQAAVWAPATGPQAIRWLHRGREGAGSTAVPDNLVSFPIPANAGRNPGGRQPAVAVPTSSVPLAMLKAAGGTAVLLLAMVAVAIGFGMVAMAVLGEEQRMTVGRLMWAFAFAIQVLIAVWIWRQAGAKWGIVTLLLLALIFPVYLYQQHRGLVRRATGEPVRRFRTLATAGSMLAMTIVFVGLTFGIALYQTDAEPASEGNRPSQVR